VLASVDDLIDLALDIAELLLLGAKLVGLAKAADFVFELLELVVVGSTLHLEIVIVLDQRLDLLLESLLVHGS